MAYDADQMWFEDDEDVPECFGDFDPGTECDFCPYQRECQ